jgi:hypothetical protein
LSRFHKHGIALSDHGIAPLPNMLVVLSMPTPPTVHSLRARAHALCTAILTRRFIYQHAVIRGVRERVKAVGLCRIFSRRPQCRRAFIQRRHGSSSSIPLKHGKRAADVARSKIGSPVETCI